MSMLSTKLPGIRVRLAGLLLAAVVVLCGGWQIHGALAAKTDLVTVAAHAQKKDPTLILTQGMAEIVDVDGAISDIMVANPSIVDVSALQSNRLYLVGLNLGSTNLIAVDAEGNIVKRLNVHVKIDDEVIQNLLNDLFPKEDVTVHSLTDQIVLTGRVSTPSVAAEISNVVAHYIGEIQDEDFDSPDELIVNMLQVDGEHQVMLKVKIVEASREVLRELGVEPNYTEAAGAGQAVASFATTAAAGLTADPFGVASLIYDRAGDRFGALQFIVRALEEDGLINTLAEPNLTALSGEQAGFLAGGEFPVPAGRDQDGNILIEYHPFGVSLNFRPVVMSNDLISLQLQTEVSAISNQNSLNILQLNIPGFSVRRAETTVEMASGGSLMIAGLLKSEVTKNMSDLPGIKDVPVIGDLISSESFQREESELVVIVTPYIVRPYANRQMADEKPREIHDNPLARAFAENLKKMYGSKVDSSALLEGDETYGYIID
ncbi:MAG: type II and III secretion system protein family protein [Rhodospirillales bacterium]|nr:type II and III secretion system protein family protein [Rhodospirillales bacterium]